MFCTAETCNFLVPDCFMVVILPTLFLWPRLDWFADTTPYLRILTFFDHRLALLSVILMSVFSTCTANICILFVCATLTEGLRCYRHWLGDFKIPICFFLIAKVAFLYGMASHVLSLTLAEWNWRQKSIFKLCAGSYVRSEMNSRIVHLLAAASDNCN